MKSFLPTNRLEMEERGWDELDILIISGDAYIDHPSFGAAIIGRYLEYYGYKVGIIAQPDWKSDEDFLVMGIPRLYVAITAGNMDSMINHYTAQKKIRSTDAYTPGGKIGLRPNRASIVYSAVAKKLFKNVPLVLGGIEASLRRLPHYDFWSDKLRNSIIFDAKADFIIYGMGEKTSLNIARFLDGSDNVSSHDIAGTVVIVKDIKTKKAIELPEYTSSFPKEKFWEMSVKFEDNYRENAIYQKYGGRFLKHNPPSIPLNEKEMDEVYNLPFTRLPHPKYKQEKLTAFDQIQNSITSHRGCFGGCSFCAIGYHQGKTIQSRSQKSICEEIKQIRDEKYFSGTISDVGGPSANMYGMSCNLGISQKCKRTSCLYPQICPNLDSSHQKQKKMLKSAKSVAGVKNLFISSGVRFDLALEDNDYIEQLAKFYTGGLLKLAPEHKSKKVLDYMNKPDFSLYQKFGKQFGSYSKKVGKKQYIVPYIIVGHPGATLADTIELALYLKQNSIKLKQIQEFTPTPMSLSTMMYYTELDKSGKKVHVAKGREIRLMKALIQWFLPENKKLVIEALKNCSKLSMLNRFYPTKKNRA